MIKDLMAGYGGCQCNLFHTENRTVFTLDAGIARNHEKGIILETILG